MKRSDVLMLTNSDVYVCIWLKFLTWLVLDLFNFSCEILSNASDCEIRQLPSPQLCLAGNVEQWWDSSSPTWCGCSVMMSQHSLLGTTSGFPQEHLYLTSALCWESCQLWKREKLIYSRQCDFHLGKVILPYCLLFLLLYVSSARTG